MRTRRPGPSSSFSGAKLPAAVEQQASIDDSGEYVLKRARPVGHKPTNWWFPEELLRELEEYQHEQRIRHLRDAAQQLLEQGLEQWRKTRGGA